VTEKTTKCQDETTDFELWKADGDRNGWTLPGAAQWPFRLPVIRHIRAAWNTLQVEQHYAAYASLGLVRSGYDEWVIYAIERGMC